MCRSVFVVQRERMTLYVLVCVCCVVWAHLLACCDRSIMHALQTVWMQTKTLNIIEFKHLVDSTHSSRCRHKVCLSVCVGNVSVGWLARWHSSRSAFYRIFEEKLRGKHDQVEWSAPTHARARPVGRLWMHYDFMKVRNDFRPFGRHDDWWLMMQYRVFFKW